MSEQSFPVIFLMGATATGKTDVALHLFDNLPIEIVSVDSAMVYRHMNIGTAKPEPGLLNQYPHRLIDIRDPADSYSAAQFRQDALQAIEEISNKGHIPLLVGGTGLYFRALQQGISDLPEANPEVRKKLDRECQQLGLEAMHARLQEIDPESAARIHPNDPQRLQRALEVYEISGRTLSDHFRSDQGEELDNKVIKIILRPQDRTQHREIMATRFDAMLQQGLIDEVTNLYKREDLHAGLPAMRMVGYRQVWRHLAGDLDYETMRKHAIIATHQLAKRQLTWLRKEQDYQEFASEDVDKAAKILKYLLDCAEITTL